MGRRCELVGGPWARDEENVAAPPESRNSVRELRLEKQDPGERGRSHKAYEKNNGTTRTAIGIAIRDAKRSAFREMKVITDT